MHSVDDPYAHLAQPFLAHYGTLRGVVRQTLVARQLDAHLPPPPAKIVDVGGGAGHQAIRLARSGYDVTLLDPSAEMLDRANDALAAETSGTTARMRLFLGSAEQAIALLGAAQFDAVLCHAVLPYVPEPGHLIGTLAALVRAGGVISILAKNASALAMRAALEGRYRDALRSFEADRDRGGLGVETRADTLANLTQYMACAGIPLVEWYGIRVFTDHLGNRPVEPSGDDILAVEWEAGRRDPYRSVARLIHLIGQQSG